MKEGSLPLFSLFGLGNSIHAFNKHSEKKFGISIVQWCLLKCLIDMPGSSAHSLAKAVGVHPSTLTQTLKRLERKNLIVVVEDPKDSRKKLISITRLGKNILEHTSTDIEGNFKDLSSLNRDLFRIKEYIDKKLASKI